MDLLAGGGIGAVAGELLKALLDAKENAANFKSTFERLETTLRSVTVHCNRIQDLNEELGRQSWEMRSLLDQLQQGKDLIANCSKVSRWNCPKKARHSKQILKLDKSLRRFFNMDMQVEHFGDIKEILTKMTFLCRKVHTLEDKSSTPRRIGSYGPARFSPSALVAATENFARFNEIGHGGNGPLYRGKLSDGREVTIKRWKGLGQQMDREFESELAVLSRLHHKHLARLVGYCRGNDERLLVYEHMENGSLYDHLHGEDNVAKNSSLVNSSWKIRFEIALGAARGIEYFHNDAVPPIIHRDIKSSNILLDENWTSNVCNFGLSLIATETRDTAIAGTIGYLAPEYIRTGIATAKGDVYALGVVLLELLTGKKAILMDGVDESGMPASIVEYALPMIKAGELGKVLDERVGMPQLEREGEAVKLVGHTAVRCVSSKPEERPSLREIVANLERALLLCEDNGDDSISDVGIAALEVESSGDTAH